MSNKITLVKKCNILRLYNLEFKSPFCTIFRRNSNYPVLLSCETYKPSEKANPSKPPLIILHGLLGSKLNWKSMAKAIAAKNEIEVYALDARNHGESPHCDDFDFPLMALDVEYFMKSGNITRAILIGHSMGGRTAMTLALTKPDLIQKLVVVDVSPSKMPESTSSVIPGYMLAMTEALKTIPPILSITQARKVADEYMAKTIPERDIRQFLLTNLIKVDQNFRWQANLEVLEKKFSGILNFPSLPGSYLGETLFICGGNSPYVSPGAEPQIKQLFPNSKFIYIQGAGHWVHAEKPAEFLAALNSFL